jgi:hypothetical protein
MCAAKTIWFNIFSNDFLLVETVPGEADVHRGVVALD